MAITIQGVVTINRISQRERTTTVDDGGLLTPALRLTGITSVRTHTLAQAKVAERLLHELAWYSRRAGGVWIDSTEFDVDDGLYELSEVSTGGEPSTGVTAIISVSLTLRRLGGGASGGNLARRVIPAPALVANGFGIVSTPWYALPIGSTPASLSIGQYRASSDGAVLLINSGAAEEFFLAGGDYSAGECHVWDTGGSGAPANWTRVYGPDHTFADPSHCVLDNGVVRFIPLTGANAGRHRIDVWDNVTWTTLTDAGGDRTIVNDGGLSGVAGVTILELTPWRVAVKLHMTRTTAPFTSTKVITLDRGRTLARVDLTVPQATLLSIGIQGARFAMSPTATGNPAQDSTVDAPNSVFIMPTDENWLATCSVGASVIGILAGPSATGHVYRYLGTIGGIAIEKTNATSATFWIGGQEVPGNKLAVEAEMGTLLGGATVTTVANAAGAPSPNAVSLPVVGAAISASVLQNPRSGSQVRAYARVQNAGASAADSVRFQISNDTTQIVVASVDMTFAALGTSGLWKWISLVFTGWNGIDLIRPVVQRQTAGGGGTLYCDEIVWLTTSNGNLDGAKATAAAALTDVRCWPTAAREVW